MVLTSNGAHKLQKEGLVKERRRRKLDNLRQRMRTEEEYEDCLGQPSLITFTIRHICIKCPSTD